MEPADDDGARLLPHANTPGAGTFNLKDARNLLDPCSSPPTR
jgi:hypothetical protein